MNKSEHVALAYLMLDNAAPLSRNGRTAIIAGELVWGAAVQAIHAAGHDTPIRPRHSVKYNGLTAILNSLSVSADVEAVLNNGLTTVQRRLHNNFYTAQLSESHLADEITAGVLFVRLLLEIIEQRDGTE